MSSHGSELNICLLIISLYSIILFSVSVEDIGHIYNFNGLMVSIKYFSILLIKYIQP